MLKNLHLLLILLPFLTIGQNKINLSGKVADNRGIPLEAATVYLTSVSESTVVDYTITGKDGSFSLGTRKTSKPMSIKISFVGFKTHVIQESELSSDKHYGIIKLEEPENTLEEIIVKSEAPPVRVKNDTLEFNASSFKLRPDANVETLLKQLPGVEIDTEGKITVNGKEVNQVLVNGKPFFDKDGKVAIQNLPSDIINKVQVTDSKTKEEEISGKPAASNASSINLTIDEKKNKGFFGKATAGAGSDQRYESSLMLNYFKGDQKISILGSSNNINATGFSMNEIFDSMGGGRNTAIYVNDNGSFGINGLRFGGGSGITRSNMIGASYADKWGKKFDPNGSYFFVAADNENSNRTRLVNLLPDGNLTTGSQSRSENDSYSHNLNFNLEYKIDSTATLHISPKFTRSGNNSRNVSLESTTDEAGNVLNNLDGNVVNDGDNHVYGGNMYFFKKLNQRGRTISASMDADVNNNENRNLNRSTARFFEDVDNDGIFELESEDVRDQLRRTRNLNSEYSASVHFQEPVMDSLNLSIGVNFSEKRNKELRNTRNFDTASGGYDLFDELLSYDLRSETNSVTPEVGLNLQKKDYNVNLSLGTNVSKFRNSMDYAGENVAISKDYLLPSARLYANIKLGKAMKLWLSYDFDVRFPQPRWILPVVDLSDPLHTTVGNPDLSPEKLHNLYFNLYNYDFATKSGYGFYAGGNYNETANVSSTTFDESGKRTTTYETVSGTYNSWFGANWNKTIKREAHSFKLGARFNGNFTAFKGFTNGSPYEAESLRISPRVNFTYDYGELVSVVPSYVLTYSETKYSNFMVDRLSSVRHSVSLQLTTYWPKKVVFGNDFSYTYNSNLADGFRKDFYLLNMSLGYNFLGEKLLAKVKVYDVLNQNVSSTRTISANYVRDEENTVLKRYVMFSLTYKLDKFGGKKKESGLMFMH